MPRSRSDAFFADPNPFNETVWAESLTYFPDDMITVDQVAKARMGRLATSKKTNPEHSLSKLADGFSWGEMASFFEIMADGTTGTVEKKFIEYWLSKLLPFHNIMLIPSGKTDSDFFCRERAHAHRDWMAATQHNHARY